MVPDGGVADYDEEKDEKWQETEDEDVGQSKKRESKWEGLT